MPASSRVFLKRPEVQAGQLLFVVGGGCAGVETAGGRVERLDIAGQVPGKDLRQGMGLPDTTIADLLAALAGVRQGPIPRFLIGIEEDRIGILRGGLGEVARQLPAQEQGGEPVEIWLLACQQQGPLIGGGQGIEGRALALGELVGGGEVAGWILLVAVAVGKTL